MLCYSGLRLQLDTLWYVTAGCAFNWTLYVMLQRVAPSTGHFVVCYSWLRLQLDTLWYVTAGCAFNWTLCGVLQLVAPSTGHLALCYSGFRLQLDTLWNVTAGSSFNWTLCVTLQRIAPLAGHFVLCYSGFCLQLDALFYVIKIKITYSNGPKFHSSTLKNEFHIPFFTFWFMKHNSYFRNIQFLPSCNFEYNLPLDSKFPSSIIIE